jgi:hypothetical protein
MAMMAPAQDCFMVRPLEEITQSDLFQRRIILSHPTPGETGATCDAPKGQRAAQLGHFLMKPSGPLAWGDSFDFLTFARRQAMARLNLVE